MLNQDGITKVSYGNATQILANVDLQASVGCIVSQSLVPEADANGKKIAKAGTPIVVDFSNLQTPVTAASEAVVESATATVTGTGVTAAAVTAATFGTKVSNADGTYEFSYDGTNWKLKGANVTLNEYGISLTGSAVSGDKVSVAYVSAKEATTTNAVLLHDVDVTAKNANGTALYFGVVNINRLDSAVQALVTPGVNTIGAVTFIKA